MPYGTGTFGSRSIAVGGSALDRAAIKIVDKGKRIAAHLLEAAGDDIEFARRLVHASPAPTGASRFAEVARAAYVPANYPLETLEPGLQDTAFYDPPASPSATARMSCEIEVDPDTGDGAPRRLLGASTTSAP